MGHKRNMSNITEKDQNTIDLVNLGVGVVTILASVFTFLHGETKTFMFPVILMLGAFMNCMWGIKQSARKKTAAVVLFGIGIILFGISVFIVL